MPFDDSTPYEVDERTAERAVIRFAPICDHQRLAEHEDELNSVVEQHAAVACDMSETKMIASDWLRWIARLAIKAEKAGTTFAVAGVNDIVSQTADLLGIKESLTVVDSVEDVWSL
ncbi:MAG: STAS domain-containing protein [Kiritimatiellae bacterium]|nr:STAS domain-containing protein [Kiritimatiellia bacterium]